MSRLRTSRHPAALRGSSGPARRQFLKSVLGGVVGLSCLRAGLGVAASAPGAASISATPLAEGLQLIQGAGGNVLLLTAPEGHLMVDGGAAEHSAALLAFIAERGNGTRVRTLINTHWHPEQTGSNERLGRAGTKIVAHENTKLWLGTEVDVKWQKKVYPPRPPEALPTETVYTSGKLEFAGQPVEYGHLFQAHTDGDLYVFLPERNVLFAGDVVAAGRYPISDWSTGGWIGGLHEATKKLVGMTDANTRIVPGLGPVLTRADLQAQLDMLTTVRGRLVDLLKKGMSVEEMIAAKPTQEFDAKWGDPTLLIATSYQGLIGHVRELGGIL